MSILVRYPRLRRHALLIIALTILSWSSAIAVHAESGQLPYLAHALALDGFAPETMIGKVQPALLDALEQDAERAYFADASTGTLHTVVVGLVHGETRAERSAALKSADGRAAIRRHVRATQHRVLRALTRKSADGHFALRNRYTTLAGFSARADFHAIAALAQHSDVAYVEVMQTFETHGDPEAALLTNLDTVHQSGALGAGVTIAVIDSGIDYTHPFLWGNVRQDPLAPFPTAKVLGGYDFGDDDADPMIDCSEDSHGTAVASIAAGPLTGVAPAASLVHLKVRTTAECDGRNLSGDIPGAIDWVVTHQETYGIRIINMSLGGGGHNEICDNAGGSAYRSALDDADAAGILIFASAGNDAEKDKIGFPACYPTVRSVGAVWDADRSATWVFSDGHGNETCRDAAPRSDQVTCYSNSADFLDFLAPSECAEALSPGGGFEDCFGGTSAASPYASGVAALLLDVNPSLTPDQVDTFMSVGSVPVTDPANGVTTPRVNAFMAWALARSSWLY
ncbi:MAG: S8 family serine peptidase [Acidobacteriota bacterium]